MFGSFRVCVPVNFFFFFFYFVFVFSSVYYVMSLNMSIFYILYVCLHVCACSYATCVWPEYYLQ